MIKKIYFITYHYVRPIKNSKYPNLKGLEYKKFVKQLDLLKKKFHILDYDELLNLINKKSLKNDNKDKCILTFDDGYKDNIKYVYPELKKRKISGFFFPTVKSTNMEVLNVNKIQFLLAKERSAKKILNQIYFQLPDSEIKDIKKKEKKFINNHPYDSKNISFIKYLLNIYLGKRREKIINILFKKLVTKNKLSFAKKLYLSKKDLVELHKNKMYIGCHGTSHVHLDQINKKTFEFEINENIKFLKRLKIFRKEWIMCYPFGAYNKSVINFLKKKNCFLGLTVKSGFNVLNKIKKFEIRRIDCNEVEKMFN